MAKLSSVPPYPINISANGTLVNLCKNRTSEENFQIARVVSPGGPLEGDFEILFEGAEWESDAFAIEQLQKDYPGLI